eukprot:gene14806-16345_t
MPFQRKKIKVVREGKSGRQSTRWVMPSVAGPSSTASSTDVSLIGQGQDFRESTMPIDFQDDGDNNESTELPPKKAAKTRMTYVEAKQRDYDNWCSLRHQLFESAVEMEGPPTSDICLKCGIKKADVRCKDCGPYYFVCTACLREDHQLRPNHMPMEWTGLSWCLLSDSLLYASPLSLGTIHRCSFQYQRTLKLVDVKGRVHDRAIQFCKCFSEPVVLLKLGFWASSAVKPSTAYDIDFLRFMASLLLESQVSVLGFVNAMRWKNSLSKKQSDSLYRLLVNESFEEFRHFLHCFDSPGGLLEDIDDGADCLLCSEDNDQIVLMLDGTFGCVRKKSSGRSVGPPKHGSRFFLHHEEVESFMKSYSENTKAEISDCSSFKAGTEKLRSKFQNSKLDITGVFGSVCKHEIPVKFLDMNTGERYGYPVFLLLNIFQKYREHKDKKFGIIYDIGCQLSRHIQKSDNKDLFSNCTFLTPDWHAYGHVASCQLQYAVRYSPEFGLTDGESTERLWSFLRRFTAITKEMMRTHRTDLLTDALIYFARRKNANMEVMLQGGDLEKWGTTAKDFEEELALLDRLAKADLILENSQDEFQRILENSEASESITESDIRNWLQEQQKYFSLKQSNRKNIDWRDKYIETLLELSEHRNLFKELSDVGEAKGIKDRIKELEHDAVQIEKTNKISKRWKSGEKEFRDALHSFEQKKKVGFLTKARSEAVERVFHLSLKKNTQVRDHHQHLQSCCLFLCPLWLRLGSAGQKIPNQIEKQIRKYTNRLKSVIQQYNQQKFSSSSDLPNLLNFEDVKDPEGRIFNVLDVGYQDTSSLPINFRKKAASLVCLKDRALVEREQVRADMARFVKRLEVRRDAICSGIREIEQTVSSESTRFRLGALSILIKHRHSVEERLAHCSQMFESYSGVDILNTCPDAGDDGNDTQQQVEAAYALEVNVLDVDDYDNKFSGTCPITESLPTDQQVSVIDEEKFWYVRQWMAGSKFSSVSEQLEFPKKRILSIEIEPSLEYLLAFNEAFYDEKESSFTVINRVMLFKTFYSKAEEYYFFKGLLNSKCNVTMCKLALHEDVQGKVRLLSKARLPGQGPTCAAV